MCCCVPECLKGASSIFIRRRPPHPSQLTPRHTYDRMSQETVVSQTTPADPEGLVGIRLPTTPPSVDEALSHAEDGGDVELCAIKPTADLEAGVIAHPFAPSGQGSVNSLPRDGPSLPRVRISDVVDVNTFVGLTICGILSALFFSLILLGIGTMILVWASPFNSGDLAAEVYASLIGAVVVALAVGATVAFVDLVLRLSLRGRDGGTAHDRDRTVIVLGICAPASVFAMPLGLVMLPHLATETFAARHALALSATGLGAPCALALLIRGSAWLWHRMCAGSE
ncbi:hypothetical protein LXA43DRAFT_55751 [Ganoderma leucocontextum]|nr:hypothetical protein LXA43DRAFT_55751 [Ganoderma leucocontextum]